MDYRAYLRSVSGRLEADDYQVETGVDIPGYRLDLYAFKDTTEMSVAASTHKQIACFFVEAPKVTVGMP